MANNTHKMKFKVEREPVSEKRMKEILFLVHKVHCTYSAANYLYEDLVEAFEGLIVPKYDLKFRMHQLTNAYDAFEKASRSMLREYFSYCKTDYDNIIQGVLENWDMEVILRVVNDYFQYNDDGTPKKDNWNYKLRYQFTETQLNLLQREALQLKKKYEEQVEVNKTLIAANKEMLERLTELGEETKDEEGNDVLAAMQDLCEAWGVDDKKDKKKSKK